MENNIEERVKKVMSAVFNISENEINDNSAPHQIESWDSLKHMNLVVALEEEFNIQFEVDEIPYLLNFKIINAMIKGYVEN